MSRLTELVQKLEDLYGRPTRPRAVRPFEMILYENVAYLVDDARRHEAFEKLEKFIGTTPADILKASPQDFEKIDVGGINKPGQIEKMITSARLVIDEYDSELDVVLGLPDKEALKALKRFPAIGEPGAEKILMYNRRLPVLALDSNGLRLLTRLGYGTESTNYNAMYKSVRKAVTAEAPTDYDWLINASQLLRRHAKEICKAMARCEKCVLLGDCAFGQANRGILPAKPVNRRK